MRIREATRHDVRSVTALETDLFGREAWSSVAVKEELLGRRRIALVADADDGSLIGYIVAAQSGDLADVHRIAVAEDHQRQGVGRSLLTALCRRCRKAGAARLLLEVSETNEAARALYEAEGWRQLDRRPRYFRDGTDAIVLCLTLDKRDTA